MLLGTQFFAPTQLQPVQVLEPIRVRLHLRQYLWHIRLDLVRRTVLVSKLVISPSAAIWMYCRVLGTTSRYGQLDNARQPVLMVRVREMGRQKGAAKRSRPGRRGDRESIADLSSLPALSGCAAERDREPSRR